MISKQEQLVYRHYNLHLHKRDHPFARPAQIERQDLAALIEEIRILSEQLKKIVAEKDAVLAECAEQDAKLLELAKEKSSYEGKCIPRARPALTRFL